MTKFDAWDCAVLISILVISAIIGIYYRLTGGKQKTTNEYLMADRSMPVFTVSFSLMASLLSAISLLGVSNESYQFGVMFCVINLSYILSTPLAAYGYLPVFYRMRTTSVYEYLERRFGYGVRLMASISFTLQMTLYTGIVLYAPALALEAVTGIDRNIAILAIGLVCTFYSTLGGLKAVLITDLFQSLLMFAAIYAVIIVSAMKVGGLKSIWQTAVETGRLDLSATTLDPTVRHTWWNLIFGGMVTYISLYGVNQTQVQRLLSVKDLKGAQAALWWNLPILSALSLSTLFAGLAMFSYYRNCDPVLNGRIKTRDQLMPLFAIDTMGDYPGLCGLFVSGIFSASLSTISSSLSSLSAVTLEDYLKPLYMKIFKKPIKDSNTVLPTKLISCFYGLACIAMAFAASSLGGVLQASLTIFGVVGGPLLGIFTLGMCSTRPNQSGVMVGLLIGLAFAFWIGFGGPKPPPPSLPLSSMGCTTTNNTIFLAESIASTEQSFVKEPNYFWLYRISYMWYSTSGFVITLFSGYCFSRIFECLNLDNNSKIYLDTACKQIDYDLFIPILSRKLRQQTADSEELSKLRNSEIVT